MEPKPTSQQSNVEKIVSAQPDEPCDMDTPLTPKDAFFDSFASGPDSLLLAPFSRKCRAKTHILSSSLSESDQERISENRMLEAVYEDLLGAIISKRAEENDSADKCMMPTSENLLITVSESCPDAPARTRENLKKATKKEMKFDTTRLCKKLDF